MNTIAGTKPDAPILRRKEPAAAAARGTLVKPASREKAATARHEEKYGIYSFVYQARRPFNRKKLEKMFEQDLVGLLRAKGYFWVADQPDEMGFLSLAGGVVRYAFLNYWWAAQLESGKVSRSEIPAQLQPIWREPHGDRRQELVFIGVGLKEAEIREKLDACLVDT